MSAIARPWRPAPPLAPRSVLAGMVGGVALVATYLGIISLAQDVHHALDQLGADALFVALIALGFGTQVALFVELRAVGRIHRGSAVVTAAGTGTSAAAMLACCAHHLVDLLPILGLSAAAVFLNAYRTPLFLVSLGMNAVGVALIARQLQQARHACLIAEASDAGTEPAPSAAEPCHQ